MIALTTAPLAELHRRLAVVRARVLAVAHRHANGFYLFDRAGTSKTYTIRTTLAEYDKPYHYHGGHLTPMGLFDLLREQHDRTIVLDDVSELLNQKIGGATLLRLLGDEHEADLGGGWQYIQQHSKPNGMEPSQLCSKLIERTCEAVALILDTAEEIQAARPSMASEAV
jgi:hypothetical protein